MSGGSPAGAFKGCFVLLGVFAALALGLGIVIYRGLADLDPASRLGVAQMAGVIGAVFLTLACGFLWEIVRRIGEMSMLRASEGGIAPMDGERVAACGTLVADGPLLQAPLSGTPSVIYKYEIAVPQRKSSDFVACSGYGLTPCHIETAAGYVRVLGYCDLAFPAEVLEGVEMRERAHAYFIANPPTPLGTGALREFLDTLVDDDGSIKSDAGAELDVLGNPRLFFREHAVTDRERVCAFGRYSAERGGLVPHPGSTDPYPIRLRRGDAAAARRSLLKSAFGYALGAVAMLALGFGIAWGALAVYRP